jgi:hypothetical protein
MDVYCCPERASAGPLPRNGCPIVERLRCGNLFTKPLPSNEHMRHDIVAQRVKRMLWAGLLRDQIRQAHQNSTRQYYRGAEMPPDLCRSRVQRVHHKTIFTRGSAITQAVSQRLPPRRLCANPAHVIWDLWWIKWHWGRFSSSISISPANFHSTNCSLIIIIIYHLGLVQYIH